MFQICQNVRGGLSMNSPAADLSRRGFFLPIIPTPL
jgi:hypothetical protein